MQIDVFNEDKIPRSWFITNEGTVTNEAGKRKDFKKYLVLSTTVMILTLALQRFHQCPVIKSQ